MKFEWNASKNQANFDKHGVWFEDAFEIVDGLVLTPIDDRFEYNEIREYSMGVTRNEIVLVVIHTGRNGITGIISARKATPKERRRYYEYVRHQLD